MPDSYPRPHDIGGRLDFGAIDTRDDNEPFHHEWEARVFAINRTLLRAGVYTLDEFRYAIERMKPARYYEASYYERWLVAIETLLAQKGVAPDGV
jgi:nitrile hydratase subunit beta